MIGCATSQSRSESPVRMHHRIDAKNTATLSVAIFLTALLSHPTHAQTNAGKQKVDPNLPFTMTEVTSFDLPWRIAFLPDGRMLVTEKVGRVQLVTPQGAKTEVA